MLFFFYNSAVFKQNIFCIHTKVFWWSRECDMGSGNFFKAIIGSKKGKQTGSKKEKVCFIHIVVLFELYNSVDLTWPLL